MGKKLWLGSGWQKAMQEAESHAYAVMRAGDEPFPPTFDEEASYHWWCTTFGASEVEFEEMQDALVRRYQRTPFWKYRKRREIITDYVKVYGLLTAAKGLTTIWR